MRRHLALFFISIISFPLYAASPRFAQIGRDEGLPNEAVSSVVQDSRGFLWIGTKGGLCRYDGQNFLLFKKDPFNRNSLPNNLVQTLYMDEDDLLWVGTYGGLSCFHTINFTWRHFSNESGKAGSLSHNVVTAVCRDSRGVVWVGTLDGLNRLDPATGTFVRYFPDPARPQETLANKTIRALHSDKEGRLWVGTYDGLHLYDHETDRFTVFRQYPDSDDPAKATLVMDIGEAPDGSLWLACWGTGIARFDPESAQFTTWALSDKQFYIVDMGAWPLVYGGSWGGGLVSLDSKTGASSIITAGEGDYALHSSVIYSLFTDTTGLLWIGTNGAGLYRLDRERKPFDHLVHMPGDPASLAPGEIHTIMEDSASRLWVGTLDGGLSRRDPGSDSFRQYRVDPSSHRGISGNIVNALAEDTQGRIWVGTNDGLSIIDPVRDMVENLRGGEGQQGPLRDRTIYALHHDSRDRLWVGYFRQGLDVFDAEGELLMSSVHENDNPWSLSDNMVYFIDESTDGSIWVGTNRGLNRFRGGEHALTRYLYDPDNPGSIASDVIRCMYEDNTGQLWFGTAGGGLAKLDPASGIFSSWFTRDGLPDDTILSIEGDTAGRLWLGTPYGLCVFSPNTGEVTSFDMFDGLQSLSFSQASWTASDGSLWFGGSKGLNRIDPGDLSRNIRPPVIQLTSLKVFGHEIPPDRLAAPVLVLESQENSFSAEFAALDFHDPHRNKYRYMLSGFDRDWIFAGPRNYLNYTRLPPGRYTLIVQASNNHGFWNTDGYRLPIRVLPHPLASSAAWAAYTAFLILVLVIIILWVRHETRLRTSERELIQRRLMEEDLTRARDDAERANRAKSEFLANVSHEIRTPINAILGYSAILEKSLKNDPRGEMVSIIERSSRSLLALINDALDLSRIETGRLALHREHFDVRALIGELVRMFSLRCDEKGIELVSRVDDAVPGVITHDLVRIRQILVNLIGNAVKFTREGRVEVALSLAQTTRDGPVNLCVEVHDTGPGIREENLSKVFAPFYQDPESGALLGGTGLGLSIVERLAQELGGSVTVESIFGAGSTFTARIPLPDWVEENGAVKPHLLGDEGISYLSADHEAPYVKSLKADSLSRAILDSELGLPKASALCDLLRRELGTLVASLSTVIIVDEWEDLVDKASSLVEDAGSASLKSWLDRTRTALEQLDHDELYLLKDEFARLLDEDIVT